jgi:hypothetical protein
LFDEHAECEEKKEESDNAQDEHYGELVGIASYRQLAIAENSRVVMGGRISKWLLCVIFASNDTYYNQCQRDNGS